LSRYRPEQQSFQTGLGVLRLSGGIPRRNSFSLEQKKQIVLFDEKKKKSRVFGH
jgi:hypothetical protein